MHQKFYVSNCLLSFLVCYTMYLSTILLSFVNSTGTVFNLLTPKSSIFLNQSIFNHLVFNLFKLVAIFAIY